MAKDPRLMGKRILVVDDEKLLREGIAFEFKRLGCSVFEASDGKEGFDVMIANSPIDAVISDVRMPNASGVDLLGRIRQIHPYIPVVLLVTGFADIGEREAVDKGAVGILEKPIDRKKMVDLVVRSIERVAQMSSP